MKGVTKRQQEVLSYIQKYIQSHRHSPSYREIMEYFGMSSPASIHKHVAALQRKGLINLEKGCSRSITVLCPQADPGDVTPKEDLVSVELSFIGTISAGHPIDMFEKSHFTYTSLCLFDGIRSSIYNLLPKVTLVNEIYNPINIHKCIIVPIYAIGAYFSTLHQAVELDTTNQQHTNRV